MERFTKEVTISDLKEGDKVKDIFVVKFKQGVSSYSKGNFITLVLTDSSGKNLEYKYWGGQDEAKVKEMYNSIKQDDVVLLNGTISSYREKLQLIADSNFGTITVLNPEQYDAKEFIMDAKKDIEEMYNSLILKINSIVDESLKKFLLNIFEGELKEKFKKHPGAMMIHHNWVGGLIEHTLGVIEYCETSIKLNPELNRDLLLAGAILHDIGKLEELEVTSRIKRSRKGHFLGHLVLGMIFIYEKLKNSKLDGLLKEKLLHLLLSNHGKLEFGSPIEPMIPEAWALYYADELSSKIPEIIEFIKENKENTEDDFVYNRRKGTNIFLR